MNTTTNRSHYLYSTWRGMVSRCRNKHVPEYKYYGARGIKVDERWLGKNGFKQFVEDMGDRPDHCTLDRIDTNGNYSKENCRWSTYHDQVKNQRKQYEHLGVTYYAPGNKWLAQLQYKKVVVLREYFDTLDEAIAARKGAELKYLHNS